MQKYQTYISTLLERNSCSKAIPNDHNFIFNRILDKPSERIKDEQEDWSIGDILAKEYRIERRLGIGGFGTVWLTSSLRTGNKFAVKSIKEELLHDNGRLHLFLLELQRWIGLPRYPHYTACYFHRTIGDRRVIFAEFVHGCTLYDLINHHYLDLPRILDLAIQIAFGLQAAHRYELIHGDIKPSNILVAEEGMAKITDFGISKTPQYCSFEQSHNMPLNLQTDIWSWGLTVLEMFTKEVRNQFGVNAMQTLNSFLHRQIIGRVDRMSAHQMPQDLASLLTRCFNNDAGQRPKDFSEIVEILRTCYARWTGSHYTRPEPPIPPRLEKVRKHSRHMSDRDAWLNPAIWLQHLSLLDGKAQSKTWKDASENRRQDQLAIDLTSYEYVRTQYASLIEAGRMHLISEMALLCRQMASLNKAAGDLDGAVWCLDQAISSYGKVACETPGYEAIAEMAWCKMAKAVNLTYKPGITEIDVFILYDSAISDLNNLIENLGQRHLISFLSQCYLNISVSLHFFGKNSEALETCNEAINLCLDPLLDSSDRDLAERLVKAYINKASILNRIGQFLDASNLLDSAIQVCERRYLPEELQQLDLLALCYLEKGNCLINKPDDTALAHYEKAKTIFYKLVNQGLDEQAENLAFTLLQLGIYQANLRALDKALDLFDEALELFQRLVTQEGRVHLGREWLAALFNKGNVHLELGETDKAIDAYRETIQLLERDPFPRPAYHPNLAVCEVKLAMSLAKGGQKGDAIATYRRAVLTYYRLIAENTCNLGLCIECAVAQSKLAQLLREEGWMDEAESEFGQAIKMLRGLECKTGDKRVTKTIENIRKQKHINRG